MDKTWKSTDETPTPYFKNEFWTHVHQTFQLLGPKLIFILVAHNLPQPTIMPDK